MQRIIKLGLFENDLLQNPIVGVMIGILGIIPVPDEWCEVGTGGGVDGRCMNVSVFLNLTHLCVFICPSCK